MLPLPNLNQHRIAHLSAARHLQPVPARDERQIGIIGPGHGIKGAAVDQPGHFRQGGIDLSAQPDSLGVPVIAGLDEKYIAVSRPRDDQCSRGDALIRAEWGETSRWVSHSVLGLPFGVRRGEVLKNLINGVFARAPVGGEEAVAPVDSNRLVPAARGAGLVFFQNENRPLMRRLR